MHDFDGIPPKKSLGQNFLKNPCVAEAIVEAAEVTSRDTIVEVGPGKGILTRALLPAAREIIAIEKDDRLQLYLAFAFKDDIASKRLTLVHADALQWNPADALLQPGGYKLVANIPYYITGALIRKFLGERVFPSTMVLMLQKEVARRIVARDGKESILSIAVKAYGDPAYVATVKAGQFSPAPSVDSAILKISGIGQARFADANVSQERFFAILRAGFAHKRKLLSRNLGNLLPATAVDNAFTVAGLADNTRAEDVPLATWFSLAQSLASIPVRLPGEAGD